MDIVSENRCFGGVQSVYKHQSTTTGTDMTFAVYTPPQAENGAVPVVLFLSGLTCTHENAMVKAGAQRIAAELGLALVFPDTSPRGEGVADDEAYDLGQGAGFYVDATEAPWAPHFQMYSYVTDELTALLKSLPALDLARLGITGHSMGGHGALTLAMNNPGLYKSLSAFAPITNPSASDWGRKQLTAYLGADETRWARHDACALVTEEGYPGEILVDQGDADNFLELLKPEALEAACRAKGQALTMRMQPGYDHSYFFIATFMPDHLAHHAKVLNAL